MGDEELTIGQLGAIRRVVKEEIEEHYGRIAKSAIGWIIGIVVSVVAGAFAVGGWVATLDSRVHSTERIFVSEIKTIKESLVEIKDDIKELRK